MLQGHVGGLDTDTWGEGILPAILCGNERLVGGVVGDANGLVCSNIKVRCEQYGPSSLS